MPWFTPRFEANLNAVFFTKYKISVTGEVINSVQFSRHFYSLWVRFSMRRHLKSGCPYGSQRLPVRTGDTFLPGVKSLRVSEMRAFWGLSESLIFRANHPVVSGWGSMTRSHRLTTSAGAGGLSWRAMVGALRPHLLSCGNTAPTVYSVKELGGRVQA